MDTIVALGWSIVAGGIGTVVGAALGFFTSESLRERRQRRTNRKLNNL